MSTALTSWFSEITDFIDDGMALAIGLFDTKGCPHYLNPGMRYLMGVSQSDSPQINHFIVPTFDTLLNSESINGVVYQGWMTFGGENLPHRSVRGLVRRRENQLLVIAEHDIEELDRVNRELMNVNREITNLQRELARQKAELVRLNELKNEFMGIAAHDLRSPLSVIQGFASLLIRRPEIAGEERNELLTMISDSVQDMLGMLNNLLNISEIESGNLRLRPIVFVNRKRDQVILETKTT